MSRIKEVFEKATSDAAKTVKTWKGYSVNHFRFYTESSKEKAEEFYETIKKFNQDNCKIVVNMTADELTDFVVTGHYIQQEGTKRSQAKKAMGLEDVFSIFGSYTRNYEGIRKFGECSVVLAVNQVLIFPGDPSRFRDPSRVDFTPDPQDVLYPLIHAADARAVATILAMDASDLSGIDLAFVNAMDKNKDYGRCSAMIFDRINQTNVSGIFVPTKEIADRVRNILDGLGHVIRVEVSNNGVRTKDPFSFREESDVEITPSKQMKYFTVGDRVVTKTTITSAPLVSGTIIDMSNGRICVDWDHEERTIYDLAEALMYLMPAPVASKDKYGDFIYAIPGLDSKSAGLLDALGIDPVSVYSIVSYVRPATDKDESYRSRLVDAMDDIGLSGQFVSGYLENSDGFEPREWFQASLPGGQRLIVSYGDGKFAIQAGDLEDYVSVN